MPKPPRITAPLAPDAAVADGPTARMFEVTKAAGRYFKAHLVPGDDVDDAVQDFVIYMMEGDYMARYDPEQGSLHQFVGRYASLYLKRRRCMRARRQVPIRKSHRLIVDRAHAHVGRRVDVETTLEAVYTRVRPFLFLKDAQALDAMATCHADPVLAARLLRRDRTDILKSMANVRARIEAYGWSMSEHRPAGIVENVSV